MSFQIWAFHFRFQHYPLHLHSLYFLLKYSTKFTSAHSGPPLQKRAESIEDKDETFTGFRRSDQVQFYKHATPSQNTQNLIFLDHTNIHNQVAGPSIHSQEDAMRGLGIDKLMGQDSKVLIQVTTLPSKISSSFQQAPLSIYSEDDIVEAFRQQVQKTGDPKPP